MRVSARADSSSATFGGLDENLNYFVQVSANTSAGGGVVSSPQVVKSLRGEHFNQLMSHQHYYVNVQGGSNGLVIGVVVGVVLAVVLVMVLILAILIIK